MHISVATTKDSGRYQVRFNGEIVEHWIEADDTAGYIIREVPDNSGQIRFMRRERVTGTVTITPPPTKEA